jgi:hypothetical protein
MIPDRGDAATHPAVFGPIGEELRREVKDWALANGSR